MRLVEVVVCVMDIPFPTDNRSTSLRLVEDGRRRGEAEENNTVYMEASFSYA